MKIFIMPLVTLLFTGICLNLAAQTGNIVVFAPKGEKFTLFIGNTIQNHDPASRVEADNPGGPTFKVKVVFPDPSIRELSKLVFNKPSGTMFFKVEKNAKGTFALESTSSEWMDKSAATEPENPPSPPPVAADQAQKESKSSETVKKKDAKGCDNPIADSDFTGQLIDISARPFEPMQLSAAKKMAETHCLRVSQVKLVMNVFDSESSRLSFAKFAWDYTYDRDSYAEVNDELHSQKSRDDLDRFIAGKSK
jgi:hypothetical protein